MSPIRLNSQFPVNHLHGPVAPGMTAPLLRMSSSYSLNSGPSRMDSVRLSSSQAGRSTLGTLACVGGLGVGVPLAGFFLYGYEGAIATTGLTLLGVAAKWAWNRFAQPLLDNRRQAKLDKQYEETFAQWTASGGRKSVEPPVTEGPPTDLTTKPTTGEESPPPPVIPVDINDFLRKKIHPAPYGEVSNLTPPAEPEPRRDAPVREPIPPVSQEPPLGRIPVDVAVRRERLDWSTSPTHIIPEPFRGEVRKPAPPPEPEPPAETASPAPTFELMPGRVYSHPRELASALVMPVIDEAADDGRTLLDVWLKSGGKKKGHSQILFDRLAADLSGVPSAIDYKRAVLRALSARLDRPNDPAARTVWKAVVKKFVQMPDGVQHLADLLNDSRSGGEEFLDIGNQSILLNRMDPETAAAVQARIPKDRLMDWL